MASLSLSEPKARDHQRRLRRTLYGIATDANRFCRYFRGRPMPDSAHGR